MAVVHIVSLIIFHYFSICLLHRNEYFMLQVLSRISISSSLRRRHYWHWRASYYFRHFKAYASSNKCNYIIRRSQANTILAQRRSKIREGISAQKWWCLASRMIGKYAGKSIDFSPHRGPIWRRRWHIVGFIEHYMIHLLAMGPREPAASLICTSKYDALAVYLIFLSQYAAFTAYADDINISAAILRLVIIFNYNYFVCYFIFRKDTVFEMVMPRYSIEEFSFQYARCPFTSTRMHDIKAGI